MQRVEKSIRVAAPISAVYQVWRDFEKLPQFMDHVEEVRMTSGDGHHSHWKIRGPAGFTAEYDAEIVEDEPNHSIGWRSIGGDIGTSGNVTFTEIAGQTLVHALIQWFDPPGGVLGEAASRFLQNPDRMVEEDLHRFKAMVEGRFTGEMQATGEVSRAIPTDDVPITMGSGEPVSTSRGDTLRSMSTEGAMQSMPISDHTYDVITALQSKLEALAIYETFVEDCQAAGDQQCEKLFQEMWRDDQRHAEMLAHELERLAQQGLLRERRAA